MENGISFDTIVFGANDLRASSIRVHNSVQKEGPPYPLRPASLDPPKCEC
jgi:hypothetical protein